MINAAASVFGAMVTLAVVLVAIISLISVSAFRLVKKKPMALPPTTSISQLMKS